VDPLEEAAIVDAKVIEADNTNQGYVKSIFGCLNGNTVTVDSSLVSEPLIPFLKMSDKGVLVLAKISDTGGIEFQNLIIENTGEKTLYQVVSENYISPLWDYSSNCCLVTSTNYPKEIAKTRNSVPLLIPEIGDQDSDLEKTVIATRDSPDESITVNSSRGIIYASSQDNLAEAACATTLKLHSEINQWDLWQEKLLPLIRNWIREHPEV
jgi:orotidine-5'-phosphate decarboxylase